MLAQNGFIRFDAELPDDADGNLSDSEFKRIDGKDST